MKKTNKVEHFDLGYLYQGDTLHEINITVENDNLELVSVCAEWRGVNDVSVYQCRATVNDSIAKIATINDYETLNFPVGDITLGVQGKFSSGHTHTLFTAGLKVLKAVARC